MKLLYIVWKFAGFWDIKIDCLVYTLKGKELSEHFIKFSFKGGHASRNELVLD